jgi:hypothetical protein
MGWLGEREDGEEEKKRKGIAGACSEAHGAVHAKMIPQGEVQGLHVARARSPLSFIFFRTITVFASNSRLIL